MMRFRRSIAVGMAWAGAVAAVWMIPLAWCGRGAAAWCDADATEQAGLARGVVRLALEGPLSREQFRTGSGTFDGEWLFGTYLMSGVGFAQMALEHPELRAQQAPLTRRCVEGLLTPEVRAFDKANWGEDPIDSLDGRRHHAAYLGYLNLLLGLHRCASDDTTYAELNDRITAALVRHVTESPIMLLQTYPGEVYPVDNCFVIGSIALHQRATGQDHARVIERWCRRARQDYVDPDTGLLIQAVRAVDGQPTDAPRGSGTALGAFALHHADPVLAEELYRAIKSTLARTWLGFGAVREYPVGRAGAGDIDSGPIVFGYGMSATGFTLAGARRYGDHAYFRRLFATAHLCGAPVDRGGRREYISGGPLGNAILFAMLTTPRQTAPSQEVGHE
jgi:hypothetical protein